MTVLEKIFEGYYENRLDGRIPDTDGMRQNYTEILKAFPNDELLEHVGLYGTEAEKTGFMAGFRMGWELFGEISKNSKIFQIP